MLVLGIILACSDDTVIHFWGVIIAGIAAAVIIVKVIDNNDTKGNSTGVCT
jgi:hypothetical protein